MTDHSERCAEPFKSDECVNCQHPEGLHDAHGLSGCRHQTPFEYAAQTCGCRNFRSKASEPTRRDETSAEGVEFRSEIDWPTLTTKFERSLAGAELPEDHWSYTDYDEGEEP